MMERRTTVYCRLGSKFRYGFKEQLIPRWRPEKRKQIEPVIFQSDEPEPRGWCIDWKFWKWDLFKGDLDTPRY